MKICNVCKEAKPYDQFNKNNTHPSWVDHAGQGRDNRCKVCHRALAAENDALKGRAADRLGLTMRKSLKTDLTNDWLGLSNERRKAELAYQREIDAANGIAPVETPVPKPTHPQLWRIREEREVRKSSRTANDLDHYEEQRSDGFVYVITNPSWPGLCKIGYAADPERRLAAFNTASPVDYVLFAYVYDDDARALEKLVQKALKRRDLHENREWFMIQENHAENLIEKIKAFPSYL